MSKKKRIIIDCTAIGIILIAFFVYNSIIHQGFLRRFYLEEDTAKYCYGIDSLEKKGDLLLLNGWFIELKSIQKIKQDVSKQDAELMIGLIPLQSAEVGSTVEDVIVMKLETVYEERPDVNDYLACEHDYLKCGFSASINYGEIDLLNTSYRIAVKNAANKSSKAILTNVFISEEGITYTNPDRSPQLDTSNTDLDKVVKDGVRLVSRPDYGCYVYQLNDKLYWIADEQFMFCDNGETFIDYQMNTTQIDNLPADRLESNRYWSSLGDCFENNEVTKQMNCGKYRVSVRSIPRDYSVTNIWTGYYDEDKWIWREDFKPCYWMII